MFAKRISVTTACFVIAACSSSSNPPPVNVAPTISAIADQTTGANSPSAPITFTIVDENPEGTSLSVSSDRQQLVPDAGLALGGGGANRTITVTPLVDVIGDTLVTLVASDSDGLSGNTSFLLTVEPEQKSLQQFTRETFTVSADSTPELINAVNFAADADNDDFNDLLAQ